MTWETHTCTNEQDHHVKYSLELMWKSPMLLVSPCKFQIWGWFTVTQKNSSTSFSNLNIVITGSFLASSGSLLDPNIQGCRGTLAKTRGIYK